MLAAVTEEVGELARNQHLEATQRNAPPTTQPRVELGMPSTVWSDSQQIPR
jgi:hypothetical protein